MDRFSRSELLLGREALLKLKKSKVIVFGVGGVGSFVCETLARSGVGTIAMVDSDKVSESNINRQIIALSSTIGTPKVKVMAERILDINPQCNVIPYECFYTKEKEIDISGFDYIVDAIDTITSKIVLIEEADRFKIPIISSMGTGNKLDPTRFEISDISKTSVCPLARVMRRELKTRGITHLKVLYSKEEPTKPVKSVADASRRQIPGSLSFVPPVAGMIIGGEVIKDLIKKEL